MEKWIDVHIFDGKCAETVNQATSRNVPSKGIYTFFEEHFKRPEALKALSLIKSGKGNKLKFADYTMDAEALLCDCFMAYCELKEMDLIELLEEQLCDMINTNGTCPSGRCNRLLQIAMLK